MEEVRLEAVLVMYLKGNTPRKTDKSAIRYVFRIAPREHSAVIPHINDLSAMRTWFDSGFIIVPTKNNRLQSVHGENVP